MKRIRRRDAEMGDAASGRRVRRATRFHGAGLTGLPVLFYNARMPKRDQGFHDYALHDLFGEIPGITSRAMFGGYGFYKDGVIFAIIANGVLYFRVSDETRPMFEERGSKPFTYLMPNRKKTSTMPYYELPESVMEDREALRAWVDRAARAGGKRKKE
jgi:DNA transformation protein